jgi:hypothetical protein
MYPVAAVFPLFTKWTWVVLFPQFLQVPLTFSEAVSVAKFTLGMKMVSSVDLILLKPPVTLPTTALIA